MSLSPRQALAWAKAGEAVTRQAMREQIISIQMALSGDKADIDRLME